MKNLRQIAKFLLLAMLVICVALYPFLPTDIPMQYSITGEINYTLPKLLALLVVMALNASLVFISDYKSKGIDYPAKYITTQLTMMAITLFMLIKNIN